MIRPDVTPERLCDLFLPALARAMARHGRRTLRRAFDAPAAAGTTTLHIVVTGREEEDGPFDPALPEALRRARPKTQDVYRALAAVAGDPDRAAAPVLPGDLLRWLARWYAEQQPDPTTRDIPARTTVQHSLSDLERLGLAHRPDGGQGWLLGPPPRARQGVIEDVLAPGAYDPTPVRASVPAQKGNTSPLEPAPAAAHDSPGEGDARHRDQRGPVMFGKRYIWVPVSEDGVVVDARTEAGHPPGELRAGELSYLTKVGRRRTVPAVRCELVRADGKYAVARVNKREVAVLVLGDWHLAGHAEQPAEPAGATA